MQNIQGVVLKTEACHRKKTQNKDLPVFCFSGKWLITAVAINPIEWDQNKL